MDCDDHTRRVKDKEYYLNSTKLLMDKKERFRKYLETTGVLNKLTGVFIDLYENPVTDFPIDEYGRTRLETSDQWRFLVGYVSKTLSDPSPVKEETAKTRQMLEGAKSLRDVAAKENERLRALLSERDGTNRNEIG